MHDQTLQELVLSVSKFQQGNTLALCADAKASLSQMSTLHDVSIEHRRLQVRTGLFDDLIVYVTRNSSTLLGLWFAYHASGNDMANQCLNLSCQDSCIKQIFCSPEQTSSQSNEHSDFVWRPQPLPIFLAESEELTEQERPHCYLVDRENEWQQITTHAVRDRLMINGHAPAVAHVAGFFLNFGLASCDLNYEYLNAYYGGGMAAQHSCGVRVQLQACDRSMKKQAT